MYADMEQARGEALAAIEAIGKALRSDTATVEIKYLDRLLSDRDEYLAYAHLTLMMPVLDLAAKTGIRWTEIYDAVDRVRATRRQHNPWGAVFDFASPLPTKPTTDQPTEDGDES